MHDYSRYSRQTLLPEVGLNGQAKLNEASVLIIGAGGLGCAVAPLLSGAGVGKIVIVDHDTVELSNLHRQGLYRESDIGLAKADVAKRELLRINSDLNVEAFSQRLSPTNVKALCNNKTLVVDAADNFATSYLLSDVCSELSIALLSASVNRTFGYVGVFCKSAPSLRAVFPKLPEQQANCDTVGVTGPSVGIIGGIQAQEALKCILGSATLLGKLLYLDLWNYSQHSIDVSAAKEIETTQIELISQAQISDSDWVIDVRPSDEIECEPQSFKVDQQSEPSILIGTLSDRPRNGRLVLACRSGQRALTAAQRLLDQGHSNIAVVLPD